MKHCIFVLFRFFLQSLIISEKLQGLLNLDAWLWNLSAPSFTKPPKDKMKSLWSSLFSLWTEM